MKKLFTLIAFLMLALMMPQQSKASHLAGAEITYAPTGNPDEYLVKLSIYRDCSSFTQVLSSYDLCYASATLGSSFSSTFTVNQVSVDTVGSSPCVGSLANSTCFLGTGDIEVFRYEGIFNVPAQANDWIITWYECCRNGAITTLVDPDFYELNVHTLLDNLDAPGNSSPVFRSPAYTRFCVGNLFNYAQDASDADGDSLVFSLTVPQKGTCPGTAIDFDYVNDINGVPYTATNPFESSTPITIDSYTGTMVFTPALQQVAVIALRVEEYRGGVKIGEVIRDIQIKITAQCLPIIPSFAAGTVGGSTAPGGPTGGFFPVNCNDRTIIFPLDTVYPIQCASAVPSDFRTLSPYGIPNPVISVAPYNCIDGLTDTLVITFLNPFSVGVTRLWAKKGFDGNTFLGQCGFELPDSQDTVYLYVDSTLIPGLTPQPDSIGCIFNHFDVPLSDSVYCYTIANDGTDFILTDAAGVQFPIATAYGYCVPNGLKTNKLLINMVGNVSGTAPYYLTLANPQDGNTIADNCGRFLNLGDTIGIFYSDNKIDIQLGTDQSVCGTTTNPPQLDANISNLQYQWYDTNGAINGATNQTLSVDHSDQYIVIVNNGPSCQGTDTINVQFITAPSDSLGSDLIQCINDALPVFNAGNFGSTTTYQWYFDGFVIAGATNQQYAPTDGTSGNYSVLVSTGGGVCQNSFDVNFSTFNIYPVNTLTNETICSGTAVTQLDAGAAAALVGLQWYNGTTAITGETGQYYTPTTSGTYSVTVGTGSCASTSAMTLTISNTPTPSLSNVTLCNGDPIQPLTVTGGGSYQWLFNTQPIPGETNSSYTPALGNGTYSVEVTVPPGCTGTASSVFTVNNAPVFTFTDTTICSDGTATLDPHYSTGSFLWSTGATTQTISTNVEGAYTLTITENTCVTTDTINLYVKQYPAAPIVTCGTIAGGQFKFVYTWATVTGADNYEISEDGGQTWIPANGASGALESHGTNNTVSDFVVRGIGSGICTTGATSEKTACQVVVHNVITPNGDTKNDFFQIDNIEQYSNNSVQIFNRWGKEVYSTDGYDNNNKKFTAKDLPGGTYFYIINLNQEGREPKSGTLTIIVK